MRRLLHGLSLKVGRVLEGMEERESVGVEPALKEANVTPQGDAASLSPRRQAPRIRHFDCLRCGGTALVEGALYKGKNGRRPKGTPPGQRMCRVGWRFKEKTADRRGPSSPPRLSDFVSLRCGRRSEGIPPHPGHRGRARLGPYRAREAPRGLLLSGQSQRARGFPACVPYASTSGAR